VLTERNGSAGNSVEATNPVEETSSKPE